MHRKEQTRIEIKVVNKNKNHGDEYESFSKVVY